MRKLQMEGLHLERLPNAILSLRRKVAETITLGHAKARNFIVRTPFNIPFETSSEDR
jgi:hypothetical protein